MLRIETLILGLQPGLDRLNSGVEDPVTGIRVSRLISMDSSIGTGTKMQGPTTMNLGPSFGDPILSTKDPIESQRPNLYGTEPGVDRSNPEH